MIKLKTLVHYFSLLVVISTIIFLSGPRIEIETSLKPLRLGENLDEYLATSEARFNDIIPGAEKKIFWADRKGQKTPYVIVYIHGFSATRQETAPLSDNIANKFNANLFYTRLSGHGRSGNAMLDGNINAWLNDVYEAIAIAKRLGEKTIIIATSTGATLATWLATQDIIDHITALIFISPNYGLIDSRSNLLTLPWGAYLAEAIAGEEYQWRTQNELHQRFWTTRFPTRALVPMMGLVKMVNALDFSVIAKPVMIIYSPDDKIIDINAIKTTFKQIGSNKKKLIPFQQSQDRQQHVLAGDILSPNSTGKLSEMIINFISALAVPKNS